MRSLYAHQVIVEMTTVDCWEPTARHRKISAQVFSCTLDTNTFACCRHSVSQMGLPEELYFAMLEVGHCARRHKIPGPLTHTMIDTAQKSLERWRRDERAARRFAAMVLAGPTNLRETTGQLPEPVASACWRLLGLVEYLATLTPCVHGLSRNNKVV